MRSQLTLALCSLALILGCSSREQIRKALREDPSLVLGVIEENPEKFMSAFQKASLEARKAASERQLEESIKNPKSPVIEPSRVRGNAAAPVMIVAYSDFECPFCSKGATGIEELRLKHGDKIGFVFKHLPLERHPMALPAARYYEAIARQDQQKAYAFHDQVFKAQKRLVTEKEAFLKETAAKLGADMKKLAGDLQSADVKSRIDQDMAEARAFGVTATPGFLVNGVYLSGARPVAEFEKVIDRLQGQPPK